MFGPQEPTGAVLINPARFIYSFSTVLQKFVPIVNCILCKAFNASLSKCKLIPVRIYLNNRSSNFKLKFKEIKMYLKFCAKCASTRVFSRHIFPAHFVGFLLLSFLPFSFIFSTLSRKRPTLFALRLRHLFFWVLWPNSQRNC